MLIYLISLSTIYHFEITVRPTNIISVINLPMWVVMTRHKIDLNLTGTFKIRFKSEFYNCKKYRLKHSVLMPRVSPNYIQSPKKIYIFIITVRYKSAI